LREDAEHGGWWDETHLWIVSDHGHAAVHTHEDLAGVVGATGLRTVAHPWSAGIASEAAVMVSGNAMAHLYLELDQCERPWWPALAERHGELADALLAREAVDLMLLPERSAQCTVRSAQRGTAVVECVGETYRYRRESGDPLGVGRDVSGSSDDAYDAMCGSDYPDAIVQIATLSASSRAGDIILSATPGWDFRARYEPIPHRSAHGALHRDHMLVPLLANRPTARTPRRTTDVFASALDALGVAAPETVDGTSFL
jgi:arylsulfatase A-like enzyme